MFNRDGVRTATYGKPVQILANVEFQQSFGCRIPQSMGSDVTWADGSTHKIVKAGTPININLANLNADAAAVGGAVSASATAVVSGTGITAASVTAATFSTAVGGVDGTYEFTYSASDTSWMYGTTEVNISSTYGISVTGSAADGDKITVTFVSAKNPVPMNAVLLHNVDVTTGKANGTALVFGFINENRLDADVLIAVAAAKAVTGASPLLTFVKA